MISASAINAQTSATRSSSTAAAVLTDKSTFGSLKVLGLPLITPTVAPNTKVTIAGLGTVTLHKVVKTTTSIRVVMVEIVLGQALGTLPTGTVIEIGVSNSLVK